MNSIARAVTPKRGRPRKFARPSRAITLTLPDDVIETLSQIDGDLSRAVVRLAQPEVGKRPHPPAELASFGRRAVIVVNPTRTLEQRTGVLLIPLSDGRALISFDEPLSVAQLELRIQDAMEDDRLSRADAEIFKSIGAMLRDARHARDVAVRQHHIIVLEKTSPRKNPRGKA